MIVAALLVASLQLPLRSTPDLGQAEGHCRQGEPGPAFTVEVLGLKDRRGLLKLEVYPANDRDFLADDNILLAAGKTFRRVELPVPAAGRPLICVRVPVPGPYALSLLHDRDSDRKFGLSNDGIGFSANPHLGWARPTAAAVSVQAGQSPTAIMIRMNYRQGLLSIGPTGGDDADR